MKQDYYSIDNNRLLTRLKNIEFFPNLIFIAVASIYVFYFAKIPYAQKGTIWTAKFTSVTILLFVLSQFKKISYKRKRQKSYSRRKNFIYKKTYEQAFSVCPTHFLLLLYDNSHTFFHYPVIFPL